MNNELPKWEEILETSKRIPKHASPKNATALENEILEKTSTSVFNPNRNQEDTGETTSLEEKVNADKHELANTWNARRISSLILLFIGVALVLYPVIATVVNNQEHQKIVRKTLEKAQHLGASEQKAILAKAEEYNKTMSNGPILDPFLQRVVPNSVEYQQYLKLLDFDGSMGSIHIPKIQVQLPIFHGTDDVTLGRGVGHLFGSSLPVGGESTKAVLTAHSGLGNATMFDELPKLKPGDPVYLQIGGKTLKYSVVGSKVVLPTNTKDLHIESGRDLIVMITCTPYAINTHRLLVTAERVPYNPKQDDRILHAAESPWRVWMWLSVAIVIAAFALYLRALLKRRKKGKDRSNGANKDLTFKNNWRSREHIPKTSSQESYSESPTPITREEITD